VEVFDPRCQPVSMVAYHKRNHTDDTGLSYRGLRCQVCNWERRKDISKSVSICSEHGIRACTVSRPPSEEPIISGKLTSAPKEDSLWEWYCPDMAATCWQKAHQFYIPRGAWGRKPTIRRDSQDCPKPNGVAVSSDIYKKRQTWLYKNKLITKQPRKRGRKSKQKEATTPNTSPEIIHRPTRTTTRTASQRSRPPPCNTQAPGAAGDLFHTPPQSDQMSDEEETPLRRVPCSGEFLYSITFL